MTKTQIQHPKTGYAERSIAAAYILWHLKTKQDRFGVNHYEERPDINDAYTRTLRSGELDSFPVRTSSQRRRDKSIIEKTSQETPERINKNITNAVSSLSFEANGLAQRKDGYKINHPVRITEAGYKFCERFSSPEEMLPELNRLLHKGDLKWRTKNTPQPATTDVFEQSVPTADKAVEKVEQVPSDNDEWITLKDSSGVERSCKGSINAIRAFILAHS